MFHATGIPAFLLMMQDPAFAAEAGGERMLQRAIGVSYHPETERESHYFEARMADEFDAVIHIDRTTALSPLAR